MHCKECGAQFFRKVKGQRYCDEHRFLGGAPVRALRLWNVLRGNKEDADTMGEFLTHAIDHIRNGGNIAACETKLADGTCIKLSIERIPPQADTEGDV